MRYVNHLLVFAVVLVLPVVSAGASESGPLAVYADQFQGRPTASGAPYDAGKLTAAHASMPFGTMVRVANFDTGRMVDVVINDRKGDDGRIVTLSRAAAEAVQLPLNRTAPGSLLVIEPASMNPRSDSTRATGHHSAPVPTAPQGGVPSAAVAGAPETRKFRPFGGLFAKDSVSASPAAAPVQYGIPASQYDSHFSRTAPVYPAPGTGVTGQLVPMSAGGAVTALPASRQTPANRVPVAGVAPAPMAATASQTTPYRVQFGAFRRAANANELAAMLGGAGVASEVFASPGTGLNLVVTRGGFATAEDAQRWIDFEGARRGWKERPVVIR